MQQKKRVKVGERVAELGIPRHFLHKRVIDAEQSKYARHAAMTTKIGLYNYIRFVSKGVRGEG